MSFASLSAPAVDDLIARFATADDVTLIVGAGASMEASLPSWPKLVERLLRRVGQAHPRLPDADAQEAWIARTLERDDLLASGAIVEAMASDDLDTLLPDATSPTPPRPLFDTHG